MIIFTLRKSYKSGGEVLKENERTLGRLLVLHLVLSLAESYVLLSVESIAGITALVKVLSPVLSLLKYAAILFLYYRSTGYVPFMSALNPHSAQAKHTLSGRKVFLFLFGLSVTVTFLNAAGMLSDLLFFNDNKESGVTFNTGFDITVAFIKTVCIAALTEEALFRGALLHAFSERRNSAKIVLSAVTFALMHASADKFFFSFAAGIVIAVFTVATNSLAVAAAIHFCTNLLTFVFTVMRGRLAAETYTRVSLLVFILFAVISLLLAAIWFFGIYRKRNADVSAGSDGGQFENGTYPVELAVYLIAAAAISLINVI